MPFGAAKGFYFWGKGMPKQQITIRRFLREAAQYLRPVTDTPELDAQCLLSWALGRDRTYLAAWPERVLDASEQERAHALVARRRKSEPVAYLVGSREFYGRDFEVNRAVLIPRPETELLVETVLNAAAGACRAADLGTGSGCILVTLLAERPDWTGIGADISAPALAVAMRNARAHGVAHRACFMRADFTTPLFRPCSLDVIVSNPPYVSAREYARLMPDVREYEPAGALVPGLPASENGRSAGEGGVSPAATGLEHLAAVERLARVCLKPGGVLSMEMGCGQGADVLGLFARSSGCWDGVRVMRDLAGLERVVVATRL